MTSGLWVPIDQLNQYFSFTVSKNLIGQMSENITLHRGAVCCRAVVYDCIKLRYPRSRVNSVSHTHTVTCLLLVDSSSLWHVTWSLWSSPLCVSNTTTHTSSRPYVIVLSNYYSSLGSHLHSSSSHLSLSLSLSCHVH